MTHPSPVKILLVDDRPENLLALEAILEGQGYQLMRATSGEEALKQVLRHEFAVILLDVQMPGMSGFETAALIKGRERSRHVPIIFLTAISTDEQYVFAGYAAGGVDYLSKPFNPDVLRSKVAVFVELARKNAELRRQGELLRQAEKRERARQLAELERASTLRYRNLAEAIPQIVWTAAVDGMITYVNQRWFEYSGCSEEETKSGGWLAVLDPADREAGEAAWKEAMRTREPLTLEARMRRSSDGAYRWHLIRACPEMDAEGAAIGWLGTCTDIDDRIRAQEALHGLMEQLRDRNAQIEAEVAERTAELVSQREELQQANERLRKADEYKDEFLSVISHELRTPLHFIMSFGSILDDEVAGPLSEEQHDYMDRIQYGAERMLHLVDDLLDFAKIQAGKLDLNRRPVAYGPLVEAVLRTQALAGQQKGLQMESHVEVAEASCLDEQRIAQVLTNLVGNAIKFTPPGGHVRVRAWTEAGWLVTEVEDTGCGIAPVDLPHLFVRFKQLDMSATREAGGTGLGLSITKALVEAHGGMVEASSPGRGRGATFRFRLPLRREAPGEGPAGCREVA